MVSFYSKNPNLNIEMDLDLNIYYINGIIGYIIGVKFISAKIVSNLDR